LIDQEIQNGAWVSLNLLPLAPNHSRVLADLEV
jgi:hypothetical protein